MPITYDSLTSDKVAFLQGTQAQLNLYLPVSTDETKRGTAIEGAFYLTTDTHRLYIGRKVTAINNNEPNLSNADINKVFPVQVSAGITTVADAGELANVSTNGEKGDMYYIQDGNVLAVLEIDASGNRSWVQVNPPTGIERYTNGLSQIDATHVRFTSTIATQAQQNGTKTSVINYIAGQNITLTAAAGTPGDGTNGVPPSLTIDGTAYSAKTTATAQDSHNGGTFGLAKNTDTTLDSSITISGDETTTNGINTVTATTDNAGHITLQGPRLTSVQAENHASQGFNLKLNYYNPLMSAATSTTPTNIDPIVQVGTNATLNGIAYTPQSVHFAGGVASLPVYTRDEVNSKISEYISAEFETANAMTYRGVVTSAADLADKYTIKIAGQSDKSNAHKGDTYKVATTNTAGFDLDGTTVYNGDLIILNGNEEADGTIPLNAISYDIVPSGDEAQLGISHQAQATGYDENNNPAISRLTFQDTKTNGLGVIVNTRYQGSKYINIKSSYIGGGDKNFTLMFDHEDVARVDSTTALDADNSNDLLNNTYSFFMLSSASDIATDAKGHVTGITGKTVQLRHNKLSSLTASNYLSSVSTTTGLNQGQIKLTATDLLNNSTVGDIFLTSQSLTFTGGSTGLNVELLWGTF